MASKEEKGRRLNDKVDRKVDLQGENSPEGPSDSTNLSDESDLSLGVPLYELNTKPGCAKPLPRLDVSDSHTVLYDKNFTFDGEHPPKPYPKEYEDRWDHDHVRMPCSPNPENVCEVVQEDQSCESNNRWQVIKSALTSNIKSWYDLKDAIQSYHVQQWDFLNLKVFFDELDDSERVAFFDTTLPKMVSLALSLPEICTQPIPFLKQDSTHTISISQLQIASLLANAFFCTFPGRIKQFEIYPTFTFIRLFNRDGRKLRLEKLKCLINYFKRITNEVPCGTVTFKRQHLSQFPSWDTSKKQFTKLHVNSTVKIEDCNGMLQVDFADKSIGGLVLNSGCVQEEIRFMICPELIVSRLFSEQLTDNVAIIITGCERYSNYVGYEGTFRCSDDCLEITKRDEWGRRYVDVVAVDATRFGRDTDEQFKENWLKRELNKAYCGFFSTTLEPENISSIATGNWGCGAFRGDSRLKALLQLMAASEVHRDVAYLTFGDAKLSKDIHGIHEILREKGITVGFLWNVLNRYNSKYVESKSKDRPFLYDFVRQMIYDHFSDTKT